LVTLRTRVDFRFDLVDPDADQAIPIAWRDLFSSAPGVISCVQSRIRHQITVPGTGTICGGHAFSCTFAPKCDVDEIACQLLTSGSADFGPTPPPGWHYQAWHVVGGGFESCGSETGSSAGQVITPLDSGTLFVEIPLA
jgi:hypothetical protein